MNPIPPLPARSTALRGVSALGDGLIDAIRLLFFAFPLVLSLAQIAHADTVSTMTETVEYEEVAPDGAIATPDPHVIARYGPFSVTSQAVAELNGVIDETTPDAVRRMLADFPGLNLLRMIDCPGTENDDANLQVARMIHKAGISTFVPHGGSVRSGGVELFLAGIHRAAAPDAEFGVHSWLDDNGREARDVPADDPANLAYIRYYQDIGLTAEQARAFYAFTNKAAFEDIHYMTRPELAQFHILN